MNRHLLIFIIVIGFIILLYSLFSGSKEQQGSLEKFLESQGGQQKDTRIEDVPGVYNVKRFSDAYKRETIDTNKTGGNYTGASRTVTVTPTRTPKPLPYPRITINYSMSSTNSIRGQTAEKDHQFIVLNMEIRNHGYEYFDAYPIKFDLQSHNEIFEADINVSTGNMLDAVLPNNSMTVGDVIFKVKSKYRMTNPKIVYKDLYKGGNYLIMYNK